MSFIITYVTFPDERSATEIVNQIVENKWAACGNIFPIKSAYWWESKIQNDDEYVAIIKTTNENWSTLLEKIERLHPYDVPCIMKIEVEANEAYENWIRDSVN